MAKLTVENFSCIESADLELGGMTVIIGPQASGKSVLSKLTYFFYSLLRDQYSIIEEKKKLDAFRKHIREKFHEWFPSTAWGAKKFCICFSAGAFEIRLTRSGYRGKVGDGFRITLSHFAETHYQDMVSAYETATKSEAETDWEVIYKISESSRVRLAKELGNNYIQNQLFIPAGRSFFTSIGKAVVAFEQTGMLDPVTTIFGRSYAAFRERNFYLSDARFRSRRSIIKYSEEILGGKIKLERNKEFVETKDGRRIPFSALSSGQQELLPLLLVLNVFAEQSVSMHRARGKRLVYIEEPEAHLFPSAQSSLTMAMAELVVSGRGGLDMVITTHSPYVLSKLNNLLKAGELSRSLGEKFASDIHKIIPKEFWISQKNFHAYAIKGGRLTSIKDDTGLIDAEYLDDISSEISREFSALLNLEVAHESR